MPVFRACVVGLALLLTAAAQTRYDRAARAREYVQFLVVQLEQWTEEFQRLRKLNAQLAGGESKPKTQGRRAKKK